MQKVLLATIVTVISEMKTGKLVRTNSKKRVVKSGVVFAKLKGISMVLSVIKVKLATFVAVRVIK